MLLFELVLHCTTSSDCENGGTCKNSVCVCPLGFSGEHCENQYCNIKYAEESGEPIYCQGSGTCDAEQQTCVCAEGFVSSGFNCIVEKATYLDHTLSWVFLSIGLACLATGLAYIGYQYRHGNKLSEEPAQEELESDALLDQK